MNDVNAGTRFGIECALRYRSFEQAADLWVKLANTHPELVNEPVNLRGEEMAFADVEAALRRNGKEHFGAEFHSGEIFFAQVANHRLARLEFDRVVASMDDAANWLSPLLQDPAFIQARIYDDDYDYWRNACDLVEYESAGRSIEGLPLISNGLSYPMAADIIDTSQNPGRSVLRNGYIESVGSTMWLGGAFWEALQRSPPDWSALPTLRVERQDANIRVQAADQPFNVSSGGQGEMQVAMRRLIFGV